MQFGQYSIFTRSGRFYLLQKIRQSLKRIICFVKGHDTKVLYTPSGEEKAMGCSFREGKIFYRCHRCWKHVSEKQQGKLL